jgi:hypothetical protein
MKLLIMFQVLIKCQPPIVKRFKKKSKRNDTEWKNHYDIIKDWFREGKYPFANTYDFSFTKALNFICFTVKKNSRVEGQ